MKNQTNTKRMRDDIIWSRSDSEELKSVGTHKDVEYHVSPAHKVCSNATYITHRVDLAMKDALSRAMQGENVWMDIVIWSEEGAQFAYGDDGVERYREDPEASVFERWEIKANCVGRVP